MATINQIRASQTNGTRSKGPVTPEGKARSAQNSTKHGFYSNVVVLHNEDPSMYEEALDGLVDAWKPGDLREHQLVRDIADARWRLKRFTTFESAAIDFEIERMRPEVAETFERIDEATRATLGFNSLITNNRTFEVLQVALRTQHRIIDRAISQLMRLQKARLNPGGDSGHNQQAHPAGSRADAPDKPENEPVEISPVETDHGNQRNEPEEPPTPATDQRESLARLLQQWLVDNAPEHLNAVRDTVPAANRWPATLNRAA